MITIGNVRVANHVMNAACSVAKTIEDVRASSVTKAGTVLIGSITLNPRKINPGPNLQIEDYYALNSFGMPNKGMDYYRKVLPEMVAIIHQAKKKAALSIAGFGTEDYRKLAELGDLVDLLELNLGCPNVNEGGQHHEIISFNPLLIEQIIKIVQKVTKTPLMIKVSPYSDPSQLKTVAEVLKKYKIAALVTSNTFPNGIFTGNINNSSLSLYAGISGRALMPIALGQVHQFRQLLPESIKVVGVGGIESRQHVASYLEAGADLVQVATLIVRDGHQALDQLL